MKEKYIVPEMEVVEFEAEDVIVASGLNTPDTPFSFGGASYTVDSNTGFLNAD